MTGARSLLQALKKNANAPELEAVSLVAILDGSGDVWRDIRAEYNLACYLARDAEHGQPNSADAALSLLASTVAASSELKEWAKEDPSLAWLRDHRPAEFWPLVGVPTDDGDLGRLKAVGPVLSRALKQRGITSVTTMKEHLDVPGQAAKLARLLNVPRVVVKRWHGLADLCALAGFTIDHANLFDDADIQDTNELASLTTVVLEQRLRLAVTAHKSDVCVPPRGQLERWIVAAGNGGG